LFSPNAGLVNQLFRDVLGMPGLTFNVFSMSGLVLVTVPHTFPFVYILAVGALQSVDASYEESAQILGAGTLRTACSITLPLVAPAILSGTLIAFVNAIALFGSQAIIGIPGRVFTLPTRIYALFTYPPQYGLASALSLIFVAITVTALYLQRAYLAKRSYVTLGGKGVRPRLVELGGLRWLVLGFCVLVFVVAILLPYLTLIAVSFSKSWGLAFWQNLTLANYRFILFDYDVTQRAILNSLFLAAAAASIAVMIGAVVAWIDLRTTMPGRRFLDYVSLVPLGLPGIVMAVALIEFWLAMPVALYGTLTILLLAYVARYIPLGVRSAGASLRQVDRSLEESARILGASWGFTMREITLPLIRPGLFAGWMLVFVPAIQELSASILLFSSSSITLAVAVYNLYETGHLEPVAALALLNMAIIGAAIWLASLLGRQRHAMQETVTA
jgi:iron(III) transport system permease protein